MGIAQMSISAGMLVIAVTVIRSVALNRLPKTMFLVFWGVQAFALLAIFFVCYIYRGDAMKRKILIGIVAAVFFAAQIHAQTISAAQAMEAALSITGGGTISSLELLADPAIGPVYQIVVVNNDIRHDVSINAATGEVVRFTAGQAALAVEAAPAPATARHVTRQGIDLTALGITPAPPPHPFRLFRPRNPPVSRANAVEIGYLFLASQGFPHATFRRHDGVDRDYGRWAWELYFLDGWTEIELYVDMHSGEVVRFDIDR